LRLFSITAYYNKKYYFERESMYPKVDIILTSADNYSYFIHEREKRGVAIVDPGNEKIIRAELERRKLKPLEIWLTHKHIDHIGGAAELAKHFDIPIRASSEIPIYTAKVLRISDNQHFSFGSAEVKVNRIGGHTREHMVFFIDDALFTGDTLFIGGCGRNFEGHANELYDGFQRHILILPDTTRIYCGHEYAEHNLSFALTLEPSNALILKHYNTIKAQLRAGRPSVPGDLGIEKATNPFLRTRDLNLYQNVSARWDDVPKEPDKLFVFLRHLKDGY